MTLNFEFPTGPSAHYFFEELSGVDGACIKHRVVWVECPEANVSEVRELAQSFEGREIPQWP